MRDPIIVTGAPRSRTSLVTQIIEICGCFLGDVIQATRANPQGQKENRTIIDKVQKLHLQRCGFDPLGQKPLPPLYFFERDISRKQRVLKIMEDQGLKDQIWGFKDSKAVLDWRAWEASFANIQWIVVRRRGEDVIKSCLRTSFMRRYNCKRGWRDWLDDYKLRMDDLEANGKHVQTINTDDLIDHKFDTMKQIIENVGLTWQEKKVRNNIRP